MKKLSTLLLPFLFAGCMCLPAARDYMDDMDNDVFSDIVKASYGKKIKCCTDDIGFSRLDSVRAHRLSNDIFIGKDIHDVTLLFEQQRGKCYEKTENRYIIECNIEKQWKLENIGAKIDTSNWENPAVKMQFGFEIDENKHIHSLTLELINITQYKKNY